MSFVPVQIEIMPGAICVGILPVRLETQPMLGQLAFADMFRAECVAVKTVGNEKECKMDFTTVIGKMEWVSEHRVSDYTFGGVMISNPKFDPFRIDSEDEAWLKSKLPKAKTKMKTAKARIANPSTGGQAGSNPAPGMKKP